jgi:hypothetical protein
MKWLFVPFKKHENLIWQIRRRRKNYRSVNLHLLYQLWMQKFGFKSILFILDIHLSMGWNGHEKPTHSTINSAAFNTGQRWPLHFTPVPFL